MISHGEDQCQLDGLHTSVVKSKADCGPSKVIAACKVLFEVCDNGSPDSWTSRLLLLARA